MSDLNGILQKITLDEYTKMATSASAEKRWNEAYEHWDYIRLQQPDHELATLQTARALLNLDYFEEARELAIEDKERFPGRVDADILLGDIAFALNEWHLAYNHWDFIRTQHPSEPVSYIKLAELAEKRNPAKAVELWQEFGDLFPKQQGEMFIALARILANDNYWYLAAETTKKYIQAFPEEPNSHLAALTLALKQLQQHDTLQFEKDISLLDAQAAYALNKFPKNLALASFDAKLALHQHQYDVAREKYKRLLNADPKSMAIVLQYVRTLLITGENQEALEILLSRLQFLTAKHTEEFVQIFSSTIEAVRDTKWRNQIEGLPEDPIVLLKVINQLAIHEQFEVALHLLDLTLADIEDWAFLAFLKTKDRILNAQELNSATPQSDLTQATEVNYLYAYDRSPEEQKAALEKHLRMVTAIANQSQNAFLHTNQFPYEAFQIAAEIFEAIKAKQGFSLVRPHGLCLLNTPDKNTALMEEEQWNGNRFLDQDLYQKAVLNADIIGIPELFHESYLEDELSLFHQQLFAVLEFVEANPTTQSTITSSDINHDLQIWGLYDLILSHVDSVSLISHTPIGCKLMDIFGIGTRIEHLVPPAHTKQTPFDIHRPEPHYPNRFKALCDRLEVAYEGELFLVNAGPLGPIYCDLIKQKGGIALDIGETLAFWGDQSANQNHPLQEKACFYRTHRTSLWWGYLDGAKNIPFQQESENRAMTYWINRSDRPDRRQTTEENLTRFKAPHKRIEAVTPQSLPQFHMRPDQHKLLDVEKACVASHLVALKEGAKDKQGDFFVREDDLQEIAPIDYKSLKVNAPKDWDILQFHTHGLDSLQQGYLAYLSGKHWLPWNWRNPSTALYLASDQGAVKLLSFASDEMQNELDFKTAAPNLVVADRVLYRDFDCYTATYPFALTSGSQSDILRVNSTRHTNAANLAKRIHLLTHPDNPQLQFTAGPAEIKNNRGQQLVLGLGAAHEGYTSLQNLLGQQQNSFISTQMGQHPFRFPSWENDFAQLIAIINYLLQTRPTRFVGDIMSSYLPYVEQLISHDQTIKFVCVYDDQESEIKSLMHLRPHTNVYQTHDGLIYQHDQIYDRSAPKFESGLDKSEAVAQYVALYHETSVALAQKYPENFYRIKREDLNDQRQSSDLLMRIGYTTPRALDHAPASNRDSNQKRLRLPDILEDDSNTSAFRQANITFELPANHHQAENFKNQEPTQIFEVHLFKGYSTTKEFANFTDEHSRSGNISLHLDIRRETKQIVVNNRVNSIWGNEKSIYFNFAQNTILYVYYDEVFHTAHLFNSHKKCLMSYGLHQAHQLQFVETFGQNIKVPSQEQTKMMNQWRYSRKTSGYKALPEGLELSDTKLTRGMSLIIRAKNEEATIEKCLTSVAPYVDEVIFVDNGSTDQTRLIAERLQNKYFNLKVFSYPFSIPRIGEEHGEAVLSSSANTLGHYYNWCLSKSTSVNFAKWDADYICIEENFSEMVTRFQVRTRGDNFVIWFSGLEVYTDGERYWVDTNSQHNEYRIFSKKHGAHWVNLPPWEEIEQSYLYRAHKLVYEKPVYVELFRLDEVEFKDRGIFTGDTRDKVRMETILKFREKGELPDSFVEVTGLEDPKLKEMPLSDFELKDINRANRAFNSLPNITHNLTGQRQINPENQKVANVFTAILSCRKNRKKQEIQRRTWLKDMNRAGFTYAFVEGDKGRPSCMLDDRLILDCRDEYEFLANKVLEIVKWVYFETNFDYLLKVDDDVILSPSRLAKFDYEPHDYIGGRLISDSFDPLWHANKTWNKQLSQLYFQVDEVVPYYGGQFSYFLSRKAMKVIIDNSHILKTQLYEDCGVALTLREGGIHPAPFDPNWGGRNHVEWVEKPNYGASCISDIPIKKMKKVYKQWTKNPAWDLEAKTFSNQFDVSFDWMDFPSVISKLKSKNK